MTPSTARERKLAWFAWVAVCLIWGTTYLGIRISLETMPPMLMAGLRWTLAGGLLAAYMATRGERLPRLSGWRDAVTLGFLMLVLGNGGVVWAELYVPSGLAAVVVASSPFWMAGVEAFRKDGERMTWRTGAGFVLGFLGIVLLVWPELWRGGAGGRGFVLGMIALQIACSRLGPSIVVFEASRAQRERFSATAAQMLAGGVMMRCAGSAPRRVGRPRLRVRSAVAFGYLRRSAPWGVRCLHVCAAAPAGVAAFRVCASIR